MDNAGSVIGTLLGAGLLALSLDLRTVFWLAGIPGVLALGTLVFVPEVQRAPRDGPKSVATGPANLSPALWRYLAVFFVFCAANSSDAFLILKVREVGASRALAPLLWMVLNGVKAGFGTWGGALSDKLGRLRVLSAGWLLYGVMYAVIGHMKSVLAVFIAVAVYGLYGALAEGADRALVADLAPKAARGRAFGIFNAVNGLGLLAAGLIFGHIWDSHGSTMAFSIAGAQAVFAAGLLAVVRPPRVEPANAAG